MKKTLICVFAMCAMALAPLCVKAAAGPGKVTVSGMSRVESHTKVADNSGNYGGEAYIYNMISLTRQLDTNVIGSLFYLNQYNMDKGRMAAHIGGITLIDVFSPKWIGTLGYSYSNNPEEVRTLIPLENQDRFSLSLLHNLNPKAKTYKFSLMTGYSAATGMNRQRTLSEKLDATFPVFCKKCVGNAGYTYTYSFDKDSNGKRLGQLTNQYSANLTYELNKSSKLVLGYLYIDKTFNAPDDQAARLTLLHNFK